MNSVARLHGEGKVKDGGLRGLSTVPAAQCCVELYKGAKPLTRLENFSSSVGWLCSWGQEVSPRPWSGATVLQVVLTTQKGPTVIKQKGPRGGGW
jgi:hypothetical protein